VITLASATASTGWIFPQAGLPGNYALSRTEKEDEFQRVTLPSHTEPELVERQSDRGLLRAPSTGRFMGRVPEAVLIVL
jgi:hypothetical protein